MAFLVSLGIAAAKFAVVRAAPVYLAYRAAQHNHQEPDGDDSYRSIEPERLCEILFEIVVRVELWERPMENYLEIIGGFHRGVVLELEDASKYLVHKVASDDATWLELIGIQPPPPSANGVAQKEAERRREADVAKTIVADVTRMGRRWKLLESSWVRSSKRVADFLQTCGTSYHLVTDNCNTAARKMMELSNESDTVTIYL